MLLFGCFEFVGVSGSVAPFAPHNSNWITTANAKENLWDLESFRNRGLLLRVVRVQHVHYGSERKRQPEELTCLPLRKGV